MIWWRGKHTIPTILLVAILAVAYAYIASSDIFVIS